MRLVRFLEGPLPSWGRLEDDAVVPLDAPPWAAGRESGPAVPMTRVTLLAPVSPSKIVCVGRNYADHARELGNPLPEEPLIFLKAPSALLGPGGKIQVPDGVGEVHHEAELAVVLGRRLQGTVTEAEAREAVAGLTCLNDVTARTIQRREGKFTRAKGFDTFCPTGPWVTLGADPLADRSVRCRVDGDVRQDGRTRDMVFSVVDLLRFICEGMTLEPGDVVATGTPAGVGPILPGQTVEVEIEGLGTLTNPVVARP